MNKTTSLFPGCIISRVVGIIPAFVSATASTVIALLKQGRAKHIYSPA